MTLRAAINRYIDTSDAVLSPTTIEGYRTIQRNAFAELMDLPLNKLTNQKLKEAVNNEAKRPAKRGKGDITISAKTVCNEYGLITAVLNEYMPDLNCSVKLPEKEEKIKELLPPEILFDLVKDTNIELPVLLAMWLSFSMSEIRGLTKSKSIRNGYLVIEEVVVDVQNKPVRKDKAKTRTRTRKHKIPPYIQKLIEQTDPNIDALVPMKGKSIYQRFVRLLKANGLPHMTFHDLRHINASVMALLRVPDKYAMERGGWKTDQVMKKVYTHTFSDERERVDELIDSYFEQSMQHEIQHKK